MSLPQVCVEGIVFDLVDCLQCVVDIGLGDLFQIHNIGYPFYTFIIGCIFFFSIAQSSMVSLSFSTCSRLIQSELALVQIVSMDGRVKL